MNTKGKSTLEKYKNILNLRNYSINTIKIYSFYTKEFILSFDKSALHIQKNDIKIYLENYNYSSISKQNQIYSSIKLFARHILNIKKLEGIILERPRKERKLPKVINAELLALKIKNIKNLKHRSILTLGLSCGLRISEVINLKWKDLDRKRNILNIINGKGRKDRSVILNNNLIILLEEYWREYKSKTYVFNGQSKLIYSTTSIQNILKKYISTNSSFHLLRHSYATYALDNGTEIKPLSISLGHNSIKTTEIYHHISNKSLKTIKQAI